MLEAEIVSDLHIRMLKVEANSLREIHREKWESTVKNRKFFLEMEAGIPYSRNGLDRAFKGSDYDIVTVIEPYLESAKNPINYERVIKGDYNPLIIELEMLDPSLAVEE